MWDTRGGDGIAVSQLCLEYTPQGVTRVMPSPQRRTGFVLSARVADLDRWSPTRLVACQCGQTKVEVPERVTVLRVGCPSCDT
jgi:hypothetical protein